MNCALVASPVLPVAWLALDEEDNAPARFLAAPIAAPRALDPAYGAGAAALVLDDLHVVSEWFDDQNPAPEAHGCHARSGVRSADGGIVARPAMPSSYTGGDWGTSTGPPVRSAS